MKFSYDYCNLFWSISVCVTSTHTHKKHTDSKSKTMRIPTRSTPFCWGIFTSVSMEASYLLVSTWRILPTPLIRGLYDHHGPMVILSTETIHVGMILQVGALPQWLFLVPSIGGRYHIIPQLAVYTTYIPLIYHLYIYYIYIIYIYGQLGGLYGTYHLLREPGTTIDPTSGYLLPKPRPKPACFGGGLSNDGHRGANWSNKNSHSSREDYWLVVEPTPLKNMIVKLGIFPK